MLDDENVVAERTEHNNAAGIGGLMVTGTVAGEDDADTPAVALRVSPNPSPSAVRLTYALAEGGTVRLVIYDALGREVSVVTKGERPAGDHEARLDTSRLPAGLYVARLTSGGTVTATPFTVAR